jgi:uncharacterized protein YyaL (SSP411 family)
MRHPEGGFSSSQDADSEGVEGRFYLWTWPELVETVGAEVATAFGATETGEAAGSNVLWHPRPLPEVAAELGLTPAQLENAVERGRRKLFEDRARRVPPSTDDKVIVSWNALAIRAFAEAGRAFDEPRYVGAARTCSAFVWEHLRDPDGRLVRSWRGGAQGPPAFSDDHALLADAYLSLYESTAELTWLRRARELADTLLALFHDTEAGGFFRTGADAADLIVRSKDLYDDPSPSGNSAAAEVLLRLGALTGDATYTSSALAALELVRHLLPRAPGAFGHALCALDRYLEPSRAVAIVGAPSASDTRALLDVVHRETFTPNIVLATAPPDDDEAQDAVPLLRNRSQQRGRATAFVCEGFVCQLPVTTPNDLAAQLEPG